MWNENPSSSLHTVYGIPSITISLLHRIWVSAECANKKIATKEMEKSKKKIKTQQNPNLGWGKCWAKEVEKLRYKIHKDMKRKKGKFIIIERNTGQGKKHCAIILLFKNRREVESKKKILYNNNSSEIMTKRRENYKSSVEFGVPSKREMFKHSIDANQ